MEVLSDEPAASSALTSDDEAYDTKEALVNRPSKTLDVEGTTDCHRKSRDGQNCHPLLPPSSRRNHKRPQWGVRPNGKRVGAAAIFVAAVTIFVVA